MQAKLNIVINNTMHLATPYYLIDEKKLLKNLKIIAEIKKQSQVKVLLTLKCFSTWSCFRLISKYLDGTTTSSLYEVRLGREKFGKEVQAYSVAFSKEEIAEIKNIADKVIFNSLSQLKFFYNKVKNLKVGLRVNPAVSYSRYGLANPARRFSRLGVREKKELLKVKPLISGLMFHFNCENDDFKNFSHNLDLIAERFKEVLEGLEWVSLGGGIYFTKENYPRRDFSLKLKEFSQRFKLQVYLEPGEAVITNSTELVTKILDIVHNEIDIAIVDASTEAHMLDLLVYRTPAKLKPSQNGRFKYMIAGRSCLAGDTFGVYYFDTPLKIGRIIRIQDAGGYTVVKKNWFNGLQMPAIVVKRLNGKVERIRTFEYKDYLKSLS